MSVELILCVLVSTVESKGVEVMFEPTFTFMIILTTDYHSIH